MGRHWEVVGWVILDAIVCAAIARWVHAYVTRPYQIKPPDENHTRTNEATLDDVDYYDEQRHGNEEYEASQRNMGTADTQRLELVRTTKESGKLYDWVDWDSDKTKRMFA